MTMGKVWYILFSHSLNSIFGTLQVRESLGAMPTSNRKQFLNIHLFHQHWRYLFAYQ